ncbi:hypothetical protein B0T22DRAFT_55288 [Podospora appendiculata]|uniref:Uncharacterized protein n=1 Tax=Podospora appendiculata TaxID=314037 RepID=A0AAE1CH26_9PEZI|nr:hypothetical protein B0T22DRAFT_55288 [Podospora appendiculata]
MDPTTTTTTTTTTAAAADGSSSNNNKPGADAASASSTTGHLAQTLKDLARGETTAAALEANLTSLENKLDQILASLMDVDESPTPKQNGDEDKGDKESSNDKTTET